MINLKIDVNKIDKAKLFKGEKGTYLDVVLIETPDNQYGSDYMVVQSVSKEERAQGVKGNILGNGKIFVPQEDNNTSSESKANDPIEEDDLPF